jgi:hypothetical protein
MSLPPEVTDEEAEEEILGSFLLRAPDRQVVAGERNGLPLSLVQRQLAALYTMASGRGVSVLPSDPATTDNVAVYLPRAAPFPPEPGDAALLRVAGLVQLGLLERGLLSDRATLAMLYRDWVLRNTFQLLAARWVLSDWKRRLPGLAPDIDAVATMPKAAGLRVNLVHVPSEGLPGAFLPLYSDLVPPIPSPGPGDPGVARRAVAAVAAASDMTATEPLTRLLLGQAQSLRDDFRRQRLGPPPVPWYLGVIRPEWILADLARDVAYETEWKQGNKPLRQLYAAMQRKGIAPGGGWGEWISPPGTAEKKGLRQRLVDRIAGPPVANAPAYGELRDEHQAKGRSHAASASPFDATQAKPGQDGAREYDEFDHRSGAYALAAARLWEEAAPAGPVESWRRIVEANRRVIAGVRRRFEALRVEERWLHGQMDGSDLDLDRAVRAVADVAAGSEPDGRLWKRWVRAPRDMAILVLVDASGSTQGRVLALEQEALVVLAEGLAALGYPHALYAFGAPQPGRHTAWRVKGFDEGYDDACRGRMASLRAAGSSRLGVYVRHAAWLLNGRPQPRKVLLLVSDGRPEDRDGYRGERGNKDTARAVAEARRAGITVHCTSLDSGRDAPAYLREIFGEGGFLVLDAVEKLPARLPEVLRRVVG